MTKRTVLTSLSLLALTGCEFTAQFFDWLDNATLVCNDIQSAADACWSELDDDDAESECENLDWQAASCSWELNGEATAAPGDEGEEEEDPCEALQDYAEACWDWAETEEDEARCEQIELDLATCLVGEDADDTGGLD
jgi:hypothetical protein